ncbi:MAG: hypothetical protein V3U24_07280 [Candidatus Neomarinimicrobiota bacterium]
MKANEQGVKATNGNVLRTLRERRNQILHQVQDFQSLLDSLNNVIDDLEVTGDQSKLTELTESVEEAQDAPKLTEFIRQLFDSQPDKKWKKSVIMAEVLSGIVDTSAKSLGANVNSVLKRMETQNEIEWEGIPRKRWYRKKT